MTLKNEEVEKIGKYMYLRNKFSQVKTIEELDYNQFVSEDVEIQEEVKENRNEPMADTTNKR